MCDTLSKASLYMLSSRVLGIVLGFVTHIVNTRFLGPELYAIFSLCMSSVIIISGIETGLSSALTKYLSAYEAKGEKEKSHAVYRTVLYAEVGLFLGFAVVFLLVDQRTDLFGGYRYPIFFTIVIILVNICLSFLGSTLIALKRLKFFSMVQVVQNSSYMLLLLVVYYIFEWHLAGTLAALLGSLSMSVALSYRLLLPLKENAFVKSDTFVFRTVIIYAVPVTIAAFLNNMMISGGPVIFKYLDGTLVDLGCFAVLITLGNRGRQVLLSISKSAFPYISSWYANGKYTKIIRIIAIYIAITGLLAATLSIVLHFFNKQIVGLFYGAEYDLVSDYMILACIVFLIASLKDFMTIVLNSIGKPQENLLGMIVSFAVFALALLVTMERGSLTFSILLAIGIGYLCYCFLALLFLARLFMRLKKYSTGYRYAQS